MAKQTGNVILPPDTRPTSLLLRAVLAIFLTIGFYGLALAIAGALLYFIYVEVVYFERINARITVFALIGACTILWAIFPRIDRFTAPGALLQPAKFPRLFSMIQATAQKTGQRMPAEVYLVPEANAFVMERGGYLGLGKKRVMGIGLPLLQAMSVQGLQAILAHEFGHFYGGDTSLSPWIYKTRMAIVRTVSSLNSKSILQVPFKWYGLMFLSVTQGISRRQEYVADALSASINGKQAAIDSLKTVHKLAPAFAMYWDQEVVPVLSHGYQPPLASGFTTFLRNKEEENALNLVLEEMMSSKSGKYDSHPALSERIQAIEAMPILSASTDSRPAKDLVDNLPVLEGEMLKAAFGAKQTSKFKPLDWQEVGETIYLKQWEAILQALGSRLIKFSPIDLPEYRKPTSSFASSMVGLSKEPLTGEKFQRMLDINLVVACACLLAHSGWEIVTQPGRGFIFRCGEREIALFDRVQELTTGKISANDWQQMCLDAGIQDLRLP